jgi:predicted  nucleic acid-binding Zn-ribbon protein
VTTTAAARPAVVTKDELRSQIVTLEATIEALRAKATAARKDARFAAARIGDLEAQLAEKAQRRQSSATSEAQTSTSAKRPVKRVVRQAKEADAEGGKTVTGDRSEAAIDESRPYLTASENSASCGALAARAAWEDAADGAGDRDADRRD